MTWLPKYDVECSEYLLDFACTTGFWFLFTWLIQMYFFFKSCLLPMTNKKSRIFSSECVFQGSVIKWCVPYREEVITSQALVYTRVPGSRSSLWSLCRTEGRTEGPRVVKKRPPAFWGRAPFGAYGSEGHWELLLLLVTSPCLSSRSVSLTIPPSLSFSPPEDLPIYLPIS